jgi:hypothetical protein
MMDVPDGVPAVEFHNLIPPGSRIYGFAVAVLYFDEAGRARVTNSFQIENGTWTDLIGAVEAMKIDVYKRLHAADP